MKLRRHDVYLSISSEKHRRPIFYHPKVVKFLHRHDSGLHMVAKKRRRAIANMSIVAVKLTRHSQTNKSLVKE